MGVEWRQVNRDKLPALLEEIHRSFSEATVTVIRVRVLIPEQGAWTSVSNRMEAEKIFLADVLVLVGDRIAESYEPLLANHTGQSVFISAESKTADIEKKLVSGVHGPGECIFVHLQ